MACGSAAVDIGSLLIRSRGERKPEFQTGSYYRLIIGIDSILLTAGTPKDPSGLPGPGLTGISQGRRA